MSETLPALTQVLAGAAGFSMFCLAPGYLLARYLNFVQFRDKPGAEQLLWSVCLSLPLTIQVCVSGGRFLPVTALIGLLFLVDVAAVAAFVKNRVRMPMTISFRGYPAALLTILAAVCLAFALTDIQAGRRLFVSTLLYDWSARVPMVAAAMRSGVPPVNGLSALGGHPAPLRYFYFWYVVCADVARPLHLPAHAGLVASCVWALWAFLAVFFLSLKYLVAVSRDLRTHSALSFLVLAVIGLDLIPTVILIAVRTLHPSPEIEWWHQDRTPSLLSAVTYAPHHVTAYVCLLTGMLVLLLTDEEVRASNAARWKMPFAAVFAGVCFASAAGCALLPTMIIAIACVLWAAGLLSRRKIRLAAALAGSAVVALLLARSFLHELTATSGAVSGNFVSLHWRNLDFARGYLIKYHVVSRHVAVNWTIQELGVLAINLCDLGFYAFVLIHQIRRDSLRQLSEGQRLMWCLLLGAAIPYFFVSSVTAATPNDLGVDAGMLIRMLLQMWAVPWLYELWQERKRIQWSAMSPALRLGWVLGVGCFAVGLMGGVFQAFWQRMYFPLVGSQVVKKEIAMLTTDRLAERLYNIREGYRALDRSAVAFPASGSVEFNPIGTMIAPLAYYSTHQIAALDRGCGTGFGGDYEACKQVMPGLIALYGNTEAGFYRGKGLNDRQDNAAIHTATAADAVQECRELHLKALIVESTDSIWSRPDSWVWTMKPAVANDTVRIFRCPES